MQAQACGLLFDGSCTCLPVPEPMAPSSFAVDHALRAGHLLAGFKRSRDADLAALVLLDRGVASEAVRRLSDREMSLLSDEAAGVSFVAADQPDRRTARRLRDCHWLLIAVDDDADAAIFADYVAACGADQVYCKFCGTDGSIQVRSCEGKRTARRRDLRVDGVDQEAMRIAEFHPLPWTDWTNAVRGGRHG